MERPLTSCYRSQNRMYGVSMYLPNMQAIAPLHASQNLPRFVLPPASNPVFVSTSITSNRRHPLPSCVHLPTRYSPSCRHTVMQSPVRVSSVNHPMKPWRNDLLRWLNIDVSGNTNSNKRTSALQHKKCLASAASLGGLSNQLQWRNGELADQWKMCLNVAVMS